MAWRPDLSLCRAAGQHEWRGAGRAGARGAGGRRAQRARPDTRCGCDCGLRCGRPRAARGADRQARLLLQVPHLVLADGHDAAQAVALGDGLLQLHEHELLPARPSGRVRGEGWVPIIGLRSPYPQSTRVQRAMERPWSPAPALEPRPRHGAPPGASPRSAPLTIRLTRGAPEDPAPGRHERPPTARAQGDSGDGAQGAHWPSSSATRSRSSRARSSLQRACSSRTCASSLACSRSAMSRSMSRSLRARPRSGSDSCRRRAGPPQPARSAEALATTRRTRPRAVRARGRARRRRALPSCLPAWRGTPPGTRVRWGCFTEQCGRRAAGRYSRGAGEKTEGSACLHMLGPAALRCGPCEERTPEASPEESRRGEGRRADEGAHARRDWLCCNSSSLYARGLQT